MELAVLIVLAYFGLLPFLLIRVAMSKRIKGVKKLAVLIIMISGYYVATRGICDKVKTTKQGDEKL